MIARSRRGAARTAVVTVAWALAAAIAIAAPGALDETARGAGGSDADVEARSLDGRPLRRPPIADDVRTDFEAKLAAAREALRRAPEDVEAWIWVGRRTAYLGRYREAIAHYTQALERFGDEPRLLRHRGHRLITVRRLDEAVEDLARAARLVEGRPDRVEPDGLPNAKNVPTSTLQTNVWYHLGLAHYVQGRDAEAVRAHRRCLELSKNPDMRVATTYWLYLALRRSGRVAEAAALAAPIRPGLEIIENHTYHHLLLLFGGKLEAETVLERAREQGDVAFATAAYGVASHWQDAGETKRARALMRETIEAGTWPAFGHLAAEAELARIRRADR